MTRGSRHEAARLWRRVPNEARSRSGTDSHVATRDSCTALPALRTTAARGQVTSAQQRPGTRPSERIDVLGALPSPRNASQSSERFPCLGALPSPRKASASSERFGFLGALPIPQDPSRTWEGRRRERSVLVARGTPVGRASTVAADGSSSAGVHGGRRRVELGGRRGKPGDRLQGADRARPGRRRRAGRWVPDLDLGWQCRSLRDLRGHAAAQAVGRGGDPASRPPQVHQGAHVAVTGRCAD